jgi:DNA-directed RNA polymerase subunit omega
MNADLIEAASKIIPNHSILINLVSRRVRQLGLGHRPMVEFAPGLRAADIALTEIINEKLTFESTFGENQPEAKVVRFPDSVGGKKRAA